MKVSICKKCKSYSQDEFECYVGRMQRESKFCDLFIKKESVKTMNRKEAVIYLMDNPKAKLKMTKKRTGVEMRFNEFITMSETGIIEDSDSDSFALYVEDDKAEFEVVRELRKMSFGIAYYYAKYLCGTHKNIRNVNTGLLINSIDIPKSEYSHGLWIVDDVYEE